MENTKKISSKTRKNFTIDIVLIISGVFASLSGIYFLFFPSGHHRRGQIPVGEFFSLTNWRLWDVVHTWTGMLMILIVVVHFIMHWKWIVTMTRLSIQIMLGKCQSKMNSSSRLNILIDGIIGVSFFLTAISGVYFMYFPRGGRAVAFNTQFIFDRATWSLIHTWAGVIMILASVIHLVLHWDWISKVSRNLIRKSQSAGCEVGRTASEPVQ